ncbi:MAG: hypothetical protein RAP03_00465, partial [Candidatus Electryonea clarkiae]|nr:hypothetical protein [Candidatus Electryonea clarkiae]
MAWVTFRARLAVFILLVLLPVSLYSQVEIEGSLAGTLETNTYFVTGDISVDAGDSLYLEPGSNFLFQGAFDFTINGALYADGDEADTISFGPNEMVPTWYGILFTNSASDFSVMEYCKIYGSSDHGLHCNNSSPTFNHCLIYDNDTEDTGVGTHWRGGGVYAQSSGMTLRNCTIRDNTSRRGAGVYAWRTPAPTIINCLITGNSAIIQNNQGGHGGGIYYYVCSPTIRGSTISHNTAEDLSAGIQCWFSSPVIEDCIIEFNNAEGSGGGIGLERQASPEISNTTFRGNITQENGGGISVNDTSMATFEGCFFEANSAMESGGAVFIYRRSQPSFFKSTFVGNTADEGGGIYVGFFSNLTFVDGIIEGTAEGSAIQVSNDAIISSLRYSNLYNNDDEDFTGNVPGGLGVLSTINANQDSCDAFNNIFLDPDFVDAANGDFNLEEESPCINAGDPTSPVDPDGTVADMGAYPFFHDTPVQFDLLSPLDGDTCWTLDTTLTWEMTTDPNGIVPHFDVWIDTLDDLSTAWLAADSTADTTYDLEDLLDNHNYYWTVRATDNNTEGMWANDTFRVHTYLYEAPDAFELSSPDSGSVIDEDTVIVSWTTATDSDPGDAITYTVEWSLDSDFGELYSGTTQDTTFSITDLEDAIQQGEFDELPDDITVYWRVRATDRGGLETDATPDHGWSFDVFLLESPDPFDLLSPANDDTCWDGDTTVTWEATTDPDAGDEITYWLFWSDDTDFEFGVDSVSTDDTTYALTNLDDDQWVYWKVRAQDTNTSGTWSSNTRRFRVFIPEPPSNFALFAPTNNSTIYDDSVTAFWTESEDPDPGDQVLYTVEWSLDSDYDNSYTGTTTDDFFQITDLEDQIQQWYGDELDELPDDVRIYWRVSASDNYGNVVRAIPNNGWSFRVYLAEPPAEFSLLSPGDGDTCWTGDTTFTWETAVDPDPDDQVFYRLIFATNEEFTENLDSVNTANTSYPFENLTDNQTYWWRVHAQDGNTDGTYSNETFQLHINIINPPEAFSLLSPENNDTIWTDSTSLTWELTTDPDPDDSVHYVIWWATDQDFTQNLDSASTEEGDTSYVFNNLPDDTHYWWKVRAQDRNSNGAWSDETFNFQVYIIESPGNFSLAGPADESIVQNDTVTVSWTIAEDPDENDVVTYHVEWSEESDFSDFYTGSTTDTIFAIAAMNDLDELNDNMHIYWRVRAEDNYNNEVWGSPQSGWSFYTNYLDETPDNFSLLSPGNGDTCFTGDTTLTWEATTDPDPGDEVDHYVIWWATDDNFTQNLDSATSTGTSFDFEDLLDDVTYRWKVRAQDNNTTGRWSDETYLLVSYIPEAPNDFDLASPANGSTINNDTVTVRWTESSDNDLNDNLFYEVEWSVFENFNESYTGITTDTSLTITGLQDQDGIPDDTTIYWRVKVVDSFGLETYAEPETGWSFDIFIIEPPESFSLLAPDDGDTCWTGDTTLVWESTLDSDPDDDIDYIVWWANDENFTQNLDSSNVGDDTTFALNNLSDDTSFWWKVRAQDTNTSGTWSSDEFQFHVYIPEAPGDFALASPDSGSQKQDGDVIVRWTTSTDPDPNDVITYTVQWSEDEDFDDFESVTTSNLSYTIADLDDDLTIYWRVRANDLYGNQTNADPSAGWSFDTYYYENPLAFNLLSPANDDTVWDGDTVLTWRSTTDPDPGDNIDYIVWWATNSSFTQGLDSVNAGSDSTYDLINLSDDTRYWWKVRAQDDNTTGTWSNQTRYFDVFVIEAPEDFDLASPADGSEINDTQTTLRWTSSDDNDPDDDITYHIEWADNQNFDNFSTSSTTDTFHILTDLQDSDNETIYWRVKAVDEFGLVTWADPSTGWSFDVDIHEAPLAFNLLSPQNDDTTWSGDTTLTWESTTDPDPDTDIDYIVWWATNSSFTQGLDSVNTGSDTTYNLINLSDDTRYWWKVRAQDDNTSGTWSNQTRYFDVFIIEAPEDFDLASPTDGSDINNTQATLRWTSSDDNDPNDDITYHVEWADNQNFNNFSTTSTADTFHILTNLQDSDDETIYWRVKAVDEFGRVTWADPSTGWSFDVDIHEAPLAFDLLSPQNDDTTWSGDTTLTWESTTDPDPDTDIDYIVWWATNSSFTQGLDSVNAGSDLTYDLTNLSDDTRYWWKVRAQDDNTTGTWSSQTRYFDVFIIEAPGDFDLSSPADGIEINDEQVTLRWTVSTDNDPGDAVTYHVDWADNQNFNNFSTTSTTNNFYLLSNLETYDDTTVYWRVKAVDEYGLETSADPAGGWSFDVDIHQAPLAFDLLSPGNGDTTWTGDTTLVWESTTDPDPDTDIDYIVWWATNSSFTQGLDSANVGSDTTYNLNNLNDDTVYWWKVRAQDENTSGRWSTNTRRFVVFIIDTPDNFSLLSPLDGDTCWTGDTTLVWESTTDADPDEDISYIVWWATDSNFTQDLDSANVGGDTLMVFDNLDDDTAYWWKVRAQDNNSVGTWSDETNHIEVYIIYAPGAFSLLSPDSGSVVEDDSVIVVWSQALDFDGNDVVTYTVEWSTDSDFNTSYTGTTTDTTFNITDLQDLGEQGELDELEDNIRVYWKVSAEDMFGLTTNGSPANGWWFDVDHARQAPDAFGLTGPVDGDTCWNGDTTLVWEASAEHDPQDSLFYRVFWSTDENFILNVDSANTTNTSYQLTNLPEDLTYWWKVRAQDTNTSGTWSDETYSFFVFISEEPGEFDLAYPDSGAVINDNTVTVGWTEAIDPDTNDVVTYTVEWSNDSDFDTYYTGTTTDTFFAITAMDDLDELADDQTIYWRVKAADRYGNVTNGTPSAGWYFEIYIEEPPGNFGLLLPSDDDTVWTESAALSWETANEPDPNDDVTYWVWWATDANFTQNLDSTSTNDTDYDLENLVDGSTYWWKVRAQDEGTVGVWSDDVFSFVSYIVEAPEDFDLASPANNSTFDVNDITIRWTSSSDNDEGDTLYYEAEWSGSDDFSNSTTGITTDTFVTISNIPDDTTIYWRVKAVDTYGVETYATPESGWFFNIYIEESPGNFSLLSPNDEDTIWTEDASLSWETALEPDPDDDVTYWVWWATDANFTQNLDSTSTTNTTFNLTNLTDGSSYWWKVRAQDEGTVGTWSDETFSFLIYIVEAPEPFDLVSPANDSTFLADDVTLQWTASSDNDEGDTLYYMVEWSGNSDFSVFVDSITIGTSITLLDLPDDTTIYWRVKAVDTYGVETYAEPETGWYFNIAIPESPSGFDLLSPATGSICNSGDTTLIWQTSIDPDPGDEVSYVVWWRQGMVADSAVTTDTFFAFDNLTDGAFYIWRIRAIDENSPDVWSNQTFFLRVTIPDAPGEFDLAEPANGTAIDDDNVTVYWESSTDIDAGDQITYHVEWSGYDDFSESYSGTTTDTFLTITGFEDLDELPDDTTVYWRVKAVDTYNLETYATPETGWYFEIYIEEPPGDFGLLSPNDEDTIWTENATLSWETSLEPDPGDDVTYWIWWATDANFTLNLDSTSTTDTTYDLSNLTDGSTYWWKVRAQDEGTEGIWSDDTFSFLIYVVEAPEPFDLTLPANDSTLIIDSVKVQWSASSDNDDGDTLYYEVEWSGFDDFSVSFTSITIDTFHSITGLPDDTTIYWRVKAVDTYGVETYADPEAGWFFHISIPGSPSAFSLIAPENLATCWTGDTTLVWETSIDPDVGDEITYVIWWLTSDNTMDSASTADTFYAFDNLTNGLTYWWRVRAQDENTPGTWSNETHQLEVIIPNAPGDFDLTSPADGTVINADNVTVYWETSIDADLGDQITYHVEWSGYDDFTEPYTETTTDTFFTITDFEELGELPDDTTLYWRVKAVDEYNLETYANPETGWYFEIYIEEPPGNFGLLAPSDEDTIWTENATLSWETSVEPDPGDDVTYWVWWATDLNFTLNLDSASTTDTTYDLANLTDGSTYYWKVRAQDEGTVGVWSDDTFSFLIYVVEAPEPFNLTLPANDSTLIIDSVTVRWSASSDIDDGDTLYYEVEWSGFDDFSVSFTNITIDTLHSISGLPDDTTIYWRVKAVDTYGVETYADPGTGGWFFNVSVPAFPSAFSLISPENLDTCWTGDTTLVWEASVDPDVGDEITYWVWFLDSDNVLDSASTVDTFYAFDNLTNGLTYWWRVRAQDENTSGTWSNETHQ